MSSKEEIVVTPGVPFNITPNLDTPIRYYDDNALVDEIEFLANPIGRGRIKIFEVHLGFISDRPQISPSRKATPYSFHVEVDYQTQEQIKTLSCAFEYEGSQFVGESDYDETPLREDARTTVRFYHWINPQNKEPSNVFFLAEELEKVNFVIS